MSPRPFSPHAFRYLAITIFFIAAAGYVTYQFSGLVHAPTLTINAPAAGAMVSDELLTVSGRADRLTKLTINNEPLVLSNGGIFETKLLLATGYNIINFSGVDRFGRIVEKQWPVVYEPKILNS
ncbi:MAG: hypothetical protein AAB455_03460 [Patescibacteria group bacterium]